MNYSIGYYRYTVSACSLFIFIKSIAIFKIKQVVMFNNNSNINNNNRPNNNNSYNIYDNNTDDDIKIKVIHLIYEFQFTII